MLRSHLFMEAQGRSVSKLFHAFPPRLSKQVADIASPTLWGTEEGETWHGWLIPPSPALLPSPLGRADHAPAQQHREQHDTVMDSPRETQRHHSRLRDQVLGEGKAGAAFSLLQSF